MNKRFRINPKYQQGDSIRQNLREENLRRSYGLSTSYKLALPYASLNVSRLSNTGISNEFYPTVDDEGRIIPEDESNESLSVFSGPLHFLFGDYENAKERWDAASIKDSYRLWQEKRLLAEMTNRLNQIKEAKDNLGILDEAEQYAQMLDNRQTLLDSYNTAMQSGDVEQATKAKDAYIQNEKDIVDFQNKIKTSGKKNDVNANLFFDTDSAKSKEYFKAFAENFGPDPNIQGSWYNPLKGIEEFSSMVGNIVSSAQQGIKKLINTRYDSNKGLYNKADGEYMRRAIRQSLESDHWTDPMFKDYDRDNLNGNGGNTQELRSKVKGMRDYWTREYDERVQAEKETANKYKNGAWYFDPQKINPKFRYYSENNDAGILGGLLPDLLLYSIAETGSSYSDFVNMGSMMASDAAAGLLARRLATFAVKRSPYVNAVATINDIRKLRAAGRVDEAAKLARAAKNAEREIQLTNTAVATTDLGLKLGTTTSNMFFINRMREHETNSEVIDAWSSRVLTNSMKNGADMPKVLEKAKEYLEDMGIDPTNMTDIDLVQHALAYNINTEDDIFEKEKEAGRQGLKKVYNDNMALAVKDYMEAIPFLGYSGSFLRSFGKGNINRLAEQTYQAQARTLFDRTISKLGSSGLNNIGNKLAAKHSMEYLANVAKKFGYIGSLEAIEEGQQELLQSRYSRGIYDLYNQEQSILPMASILEDVHLATDAVAAYMGMLSGDPDNGSHLLRRVMQIGGITGMLMGGGAFQAVSNIFPSDGKDNIRNLFAQIKNDKVMDILIGDHYGQAQDDQHLGIFYDALQRHGVSIDRLRKSVEDLKVFKGNLVTDDYIDRDVELLNNLYYIQEHPLFKSYLNEKGIKLGMPEHKQAIVQSARKLTQLRDASKYIEYDNHELDLIKNATFREIMSRIDNPVGEAMDPEYDALIEMMWNSYQDYKKRRQTGRKKLLGVYDNLLKNENVQDWQLSKAREDIDKYDAEHEYTYTEYAELYLNHLYSSRFVLNSEDLLQRLKDRKALLEEISKELGIDVSTSRLGSMIKSIEKTEGEMLKLFDDDMSKVMNEAIKELNKKAKPGQKKISLIENAAKRLEKQYGRLPAQDEFNKILRRMILNRSVYDSIEPVANAILKGKIDPRVALLSVAQLSWKLLSKPEKDLFLKQINEQREKDGKKPLTSKGVVFEYNKQQADKLKKLRDLADLYKKHLHEHTDQDDTVLDIDVDAESMQKEAADLLFDYEMQYHDELKRINHREYLRESLSPQEINDLADNNNTDAIDVLNLDFDATIQELSDQNTDFVQSNNEKENTDEIIDYAAENTDSIQDFEGENTDSPEDIKPSKKTIMSDDERSLREKLGMIDEDTEGFPEDKGDEESTDDTDEEIGNEEENTDEIQDLESSNTDAIHDLGAQNTDQPQDDEDYNEKNERFILTPNQIYNDFLGLTFKYDPSIEKAPDWVAGIKEADDKVIPIKFKNGGKLKSPAELAKKLIVPGWFEKADKYFVITADKTSVVDIKNPDNLVVALILQDGKDCYATFLSGLAKRKKGYTKDEEKDLRNKMDQMFWSSFKYGKDGETYVVKDLLTGQVDMQNVELGKFISRRSAYLQSHIDVDPTTIDNDKEGRSIVNTWYLALDIKERNRVDLLTRSFLSGGRPVHSNEHIDELISNLRNTRNQIIDALLDKDADGNYVLKADPTEYKEGSPLNLRISDGKINDQKDGVDYVFRSLLDGGFGMSSNLEELTEQINNEEVRLGVGRGERAFSPFAIDKIDPTSLGTYNDAGKGKAGKIYFIAETVSGKDRAIMLSERKFRDSAEDVNPNDIQLAFNTDGTLKENMVPSIAEFILYLITDRIDNSVFTGIRTKDIQALKEALIGNEENDGTGVIVNHGKRTWVEYKEEKQQKHFAKKQFFINEEAGTIIIALEDKYGTPRSVQFNISNDENSIFLDETQRRIVIAAIANNLHWNTPWVLMTELLDYGILEALRNYFTNNPSAEEYKIAGIDDLTFKKSDLFNDDMSNKNVSLVAWMIGTKKLMTTVGDTIFYAPFVYCDGVELKNPAQNAVKKVEQEVKNRKKLTRKQTKQKNTKVPTLESIQSRLSKFDSERIGNTLHISEALESEEVKAYALFDVDAGTIENPASEEDITARLKDSVKRFIQYVKDKHGVEIKEEDVEMPDSSDYDAVSSGQALFTASLLPDGKAVVMIESVDDIVNLTLDEGYTVQGVFAEEPGEGIMDADRARKWIKETLGLNDAQIIVTNAVLKSVSNKTVYGVMTVMNNVLTDVIEGTFFLPKYGGSAIHYHEAFHYVNLLLHSRRKRQQIYEEYIKRHPEYNNFSKRRIEELLADEFAEYCKTLEEREESLANKNIFSRWAIKLFNRFIEFIRLFGKKDQIKLLFDGIIKGNYKNQLIDLESLEDFLKAYNGEAYKNFDAEGATEELIDNFKTISTYQLFYTVAENMAHGFIDFMNIKKAENVANINQKSFERYLNKVRINNLRKKNPFVQDVVENPAAFINTINALLKQYGIIGKNKKNVEKTATGEGQLNEQNRPDDSIAQLSQLYDNYIIDQKTNVAYRAKLFLTQIRDVRFEYNEETGQNEVVQKTDPETGLPMYVSFDDAWQIITKELHEVDSFLELLSEVQRLSKTKAFFNELYKNISSIGNDIQLQTQIYSTVNKHLAKVLLILMTSDRKKMSKSKLYLDAILGLDIKTSQKLTEKYDQERILEIVNDNRLKARRMLPRDWSADFFSSAAIKYDEFYHIDQKYVKDVIRKNFDDIRSVIASARGGNSRLKEMAFEHVFPKVVLLLNDMSIPFDDDVLTEYLMMHVPTPKGKKKSDAVNHDGIGIDLLFAAMDEILQDPKATKDKSANIAFFVNTVFNATHTPQIKVRKKNVAGLNIKGYSSAKQLDEIYVGYGGEIEKMAIAYNNVHPSSRELSVTGPGGKLIYPIGENNFISDVTRWINKNYGDFVNKLSNTTYAHNSKILDVARLIIKNGKVGDLEFKLNVYVGMEDEKLKKGVDYFGINAMEDVISKMLLSDNNMIVLPTMADKKTYYVLELVSRKGGSTEAMFNLPHDLLIERESDMFPGKKALRFSDETLDLFAGYFLDEIDSLEEYYDKDNIKAVVENKNIRKNNFHGKVKNGRMDFSGNGGKFRYFYGLNFPGLPGEDLGGLNLNQLLEYEYNLQKEAEDPISGDGNWFYRRNSGEMDGFESVRRRLEEIRNYFVNDDAEGFYIRPELYDAINDMLIRRVYDNMDKFSKPGITQIIKRLSYKDSSDPNSVEEWHWTNRAIPNQLISKYAEKFKLIGKDPLTQKQLKISSSSSYSRSDKSDALILSVIGNYTVLSIVSVMEIEKVYSGDPAFYKWKYSKSTDHRIVNEQAVDLQILTDKDSDKIKRLGGLLSPGAELRTDFSKEEYDRFPWLRGTKYINATIKDVISDSLYFDEIKDIFTRQLVADQLRQAGVDKRRIDEVYTNNDAFKKEFDALSNDIKSTILSLAEEQVKPYKGINVTDAQVLIRPDMYRKVRMMLGTWSVIPQKITYKTYTGEVMTTTYSDNEAFEILENDAEWMIDPEKAAKVSRLQLYPLKMSYFKNDPRSLRGSSYNLAYSVYDKMAIFPAFKYIMRSTTGQQIYNRMNDETKGVLDMITVESAVKVGMSQDAYLPYKSGTTSLSTLHASLDNPSACVLDSDTEKWNDSNNTLNVEVQDIRGLRMQLNTEAHLDEERSIGTQMFKILFGNIYDDEKYTGGDTNNKSRTGKEIRREIMDCINALTDIGVKQIKNKFYGEDGKIDSKKVHKYFKQIAENNGLPNSVIELLNTSGTVESLMQRVLFELSVSSLVNSYVIDIPTKGGSAIQQSILGTVSYDSNQIRTQVELIDGYWVPNDGKELNWNEKDGTMEVMLSLNFFKSVVPIEYLKTPKMMRNWLINHDVIKGWKAPDESGNREFSEGMVFGVGYRIPTQGMSSTFAFRVADVLPEQAGDVIIVPREFTALTGSDFDVDKIYLATMSFKSGVLELVGEDLSQSTKGAISNKLLLNYITVLTDIKNRSNARGSIDTVTNIIQDSTLPAIRQSNNKYRESMYELDPYFQLRRKMEFSIGKSGIGPFALNITNLALTQFAHISIDYGENEFGFGKLDEITGQDGIRISDWLSAMINAHVDVAKDPYVFDLNINSCTYNMTNFLLRAGKGESTFLFLAQPALKEYADEFNNYGGLYGQNLKYEAEKASKYTLLDQKINDYAQRLSLAINNIKNKETKKAWKESLNRIKSDEYNNWGIIFDSNASKEALKSPQSLKGLQFLLLSLIAFKKITPYADEMSELVKKSRIDTKKFGNTLALRRDFINEYKKFKNAERDVKWINTDDSMLKPLSKYFESTFLEKKLYASINMMNDILKKDVVTASEEFDSIVNTIFGEIYGFTSVVDEFGNRIHPYETVFDKLSVQSISNELENTFRHKMLFMYGPKIYDNMTGVDSSNDSYDYYQTQKDRGYSGVIDFTFGGDPDVMLSELKRIWNGDPKSDDPYEQSSIFENISTVISILENSDIEDRKGLYKGLVDENGRVINELINYLRPQPANEKFDIPRLLLKKTNRNTATSEKSKLMSSFSFMLSHSSQVIRRLARDIAIYAYYSGYNTNSSYSFFDLVPVQYRKQYDEAIKMGVENFSFVTMAQVGAEQGIQDYKENCKPLIDTICRNFYSDDKIVPLFEFPKDLATDIIKWKGTYSGRNIKSKRAKDVVSEWFATTTNNKPYLKMETNGETFLYRKVGFYVKHEGKELTYNENGEVAGNKWYVYVLTEKLGIHNKNLHQYELFADTWSDSIFEQNKLPDGFNVERVEQDIYSLMDNSQKQLNKAYEKSNNPKKKLTIISFVPYDTLAVEESSIRSDIDTAENNSIIYTNNVNNYISNNADIIYNTGAINEDMASLLWDENWSGTVAITYEPQVLRDESYSEKLWRHDIAVRTLDVLNNVPGTIESILVPNTEYGLLLKEVYDEGDYNFAENFYIISLESPQKSNVVSDRKKSLIKFEDDVIKGALLMDKVLQSVETKSNNTDVVLDISSTGPDTINDAPQLIIKGSIDELKEKLRLHNKAINESKKSTNNTKCD